MAALGAPAWTASATRRKAAVYAAGSWLQGYQAPFISWAKRTMDGTPSDPNRARRETMSAIAASVTAARPAQGWRVTIRTAPAARACSAAAARFTPSSGVSGNETKVTTSAGGAPRSAVRASTLWLAQSRFTPTQTPDSGPLRAMRPRRASWVAGPGGDGQADATASAGLAAAGSLAGTADGAGDAAGAPDEQAATMTSARAIAPRARRCPLGSRDVTFRQARQCVASGGTWAEHHGHSGPFSFQSVIGAYLPLVDAEIVGRPGRAPDRSGPLPWPVGSAPEAPLSSEDARRTGRPGAAACRTLRGARGAKSGVASSRSTPREQERPMHDRSELVGAWHLRSWDSAFDNGSVGNSMGVAPVGVLVYTADGTVIVTISAADRPPIDGNDPFGASTTSGSRQWGHSLPTLGRTTSTVPT